MQVSQEPFQLIGRLIPSVGDFRIHLFVRVDFLENTQQTLLIFGQRSTGSTALGLFAPNVIRIEWWHTF